MTNDRFQMVDFVRRWGGSASAAQLDPQCKVFTTPNINGFISYRIEFGRAVVFGDPVCSPSDIPLLVQAFHDYCKQQGWNIVYITTTSKYAKWAIKNACGALVEFGEELVIDPHNDPRERAGSHGSLVRRKTKHSLNEGTKIHEYLNNDPELEQKIEQVGISWLNNRRGPQIYISHIRLFDDRSGKRWFYAKKNNQIVGVVLLNQIQSRQGWLLNHLMITPDAPHGTPELLVVSALEKVAHEGCHFVTFGAVPATAKTGEIQGLGKFSTLLTQISLKTANQIFHLDGRRTFWEKFHPDSEPSYLLFSQPKIHLPEILALMRALNVV